MKRKLMTMVAATCLTGMFGQTAQAQNKDPAIQQPGVAAQGAFPDIVCRPGYFQSGPRLCMTLNRGPNSFANAEVDCQDIKGRVADYADWRYRAFRTAPPAVLSVVVGSWLGPITADNRALFINQADIADFDGETSRFDSRVYRCAHDDTL